ncbi:MAG: hypothetical protein U5M53_04160 [Rhodoferax sp.]|nr:hypothetical protein [Rhodoferax sp.]
MSLFRWFSKKVAAPAPVEESSGFGNIDATQPYPSGGRSRAKSPQSVPGTAANRKSERLERREMLYAVVRGSMTGAGLLSTSYKFKVLSLDSRGRQYLIMMDMARQNVGDPQRLSDIEIHIAKVAKSRHDILVTAVYWRVNEHVTTGLAHIATVAAAPVVVAAVPAAPASAASRYEPLQQDEVVAFKQALASIPSPAALSAPGEIVRSGRRNPSPPVFQDTELDDRNSPLSGTQYGELN